MPMLSYKCCVCGRYFDTEQQCSRHENNNHPTIKERFQLLVSNPGRFFRVSMGDTCYIAYSDTGLIIQNNERTTLLLSDAAYGAGLSIAFHLKSEFVPTFEL